MRNLLKIMSKDELTIIERIKEIVDNNLVEIANAPLKDTSRVFDFSTFFNSLVNRLEINNPEYHGLSLLLNDDKSRETIIKIALDRLREHNIRFF